MTKQIVSVPDIGGAEGVEVIEISVVVGDSVEQEQDIVVLETDKASMDIPCPVAGAVIAVNIQVGDKVSEGDALIEVEVASADVTEETAGVDSVEESTPAPEEVPVETSVAEAPANTSASATTQIVMVIPEGAEDAEVIEVCVSEGDDVTEGDSVIVLETDKASMEIPATASGKVVSIAIQQGDKTAVDSQILVLEVSGATPDPVEATVEPAPEAESSQETEAHVEPLIPAPTTEQAAIVSASQSTDIYAGPAVRKLAREMAVDLTQVNGTGDRGRIIRQDVKAYVKQVMTGEKSVSAAGVSSGSGIPAIPAVDFSKFGEIEMLPMSKIKKLTAENMSRNWLNIPHVTQFDDADITDLEEFRKSLKAEAEKRGVKLTPLPFLLKACAAALVAEPSFNVSMHHDGEHIVQKKYVNIGVAVDSPAGLVVPVIRDVDKKGLWELAAEFMEIIDKARNGKLTAKDMQGGCFTITSLGAMGGQGFTPIVNAPEVAILAVSKAEIKPKWNGSEFIPRNMLPLCLSYDHRAINGGDAGRFFTYLGSVIADVRRLLL